MATARTAPLIRHLRRLAACAGDGVPDSHLLARFVRLRDEEAFAALVRRHGRLVLGVGCRVLGDVHAAEDCLQATFLVLARKARSLTVAHTLGPWLYGVAYRTALKARARAARQRRDEARAARSSAVENADALAWRDLRPVLDELIAALPEKYRAALVLCHLEGLTVAQAARRLGCPQGTVAGRLARAKERLRGQLARRGVTLSAGALAAVTAQEVGAAVPTALACSTAKAALLAATGKAAPIGLITSHGATLVKGVLETMSTSKLATTAFLLVMAAGATGVGLLARQEGGGTGTAAQPAPASANPGTDNARVPETNPEERIYAALRDRGCWRSPTRDFAIWVEEVDGRRLLNVLLKRCDGKGDVVGITTCREAELKADRERQTLYVHMKNGEWRGDDGSRGYFQEREVQTSLAVGRAEGVSPPVAKQGYAPKGPMASPEAYVIEPPDVLRIQAGEKVALPARALDGSHLVRPDGTISLGAYGTVRVTGLTVDRAADAIAVELKKAGVARPLSAAQIKRELKVEVEAINSKFCYVIHDLGGGESQVFRFPLRGSEAVLDILPQISGLSGAAPEVRVWIERGEARADKPAQVLKVNWKAITQSGNAARNYQILPGDRIHIQSEKVPKAPTEPQAKTDGEAGKAIEAVVPEGATIRVAPDTKVKLTQVKTRHGNRVRLETPGVVIEAARLRLKSKGFITEFEATEGDAFQTRSYPAGD
jgi:RNA polymerase sigma factor (sigma-70 family)